MKALLFCLIFLASCYHIPDLIELKIPSPTEEPYFSSLPSPFSPLSSDEIGTPFGRELLIAHTFAKELDLYRAISTYKRALILLPPSHPRQQEIEYAIFLSYCLGGRHKEAIDYFETTTLPFVDQSFPPIQDLFILLYECYREVGDETRQYKVLQMLGEHYPSTQQMLALSMALREADLSLLQTSPTYQQPVQDLLSDYRAQKKSITKAQVFNALCPGAGYLYLGQKRSALTAFLLNSLFLGAAYQFYHRGNLAASLITIGFEAGWYFGGIYGAGEEAKYFNERLYEVKASELLSQNRLYPGLMLKYGF
jgi:tetratricopeptide (TPR) repeat protein